MTKVNLKAEWPTVRLGDFVDLVSGFPFKSDLFTNKPEDVPLVKGENLHQGYIDWKYAKRWKASEFAQYERFQLNQNDVVLAMDRPWIEAGLKFSWIKRHDPKALLVQRVARMRGIKGLSTCYLRYIIGSSQFTDYIKPIVTGVNVPHISGQQIKEFEFLLPPLHIQCRIATILSAYDDLIENNTRRIQILEEMVRRIYEEWFEHLRFPGHENVRMVESTFGLIPAGWNTATLKDICSFISRGISPKYNDVSEQFVINQKCIRDEKLNLRFVRRHSCNVPSDKVVRFGDVLINSTGVGTLGRVAQVYTDVRNYTVDTHVTIVRPRSEIDRDYLGLSLLKLQTHFDRLGFGATGQTELSRASVANTEIRLPPANVQDSFSKTVSPMRKNAILLTQKNENLRCTRDLLLPKMISGEIDVSNFPEPVTD